MAFMALLALTACAQPPRNDAGAPPSRDDTRSNEHSDRGMRDSHTM
jgi:hypothetical protein